MEGIDIRKKGFPFSWLLLAGAGIFLLAWSVALIFVEKKPADKELERAAAVAKKEEPKVVQPPEVKAAPELPAPLDPKVKEMQADVERELAKMMGGLQGALKTERERIFKEVAAMKAAKGGGGAGLWNLGLSVAPPTALVASQLRLPPGQGLVVTRVAPKSPAEAAGIKMHDVLLEADGAAIPSDPGRFKKTLDARAAGAVVRLTTVRAGVETKREITVP